MLEIVVNHGSTLSSAYFKSYLKLILNSRTSDIEEAKNVLFQHLFNNDPDKFGKETYQNFLQAYSELVNNK